VGVFALQDDLRDKVLRSVQYAQKGNITVRMVSGDHQQTALAVAVKAGILTQEDANNQKLSCIPAEQFRNLVGGLRKGPKDEPMIANKQEFQRIVNQLRVISRATPKDKHLLVVGL
jgi:magnesium-transporting ATPase (P-type)